MTVPPSSETAHAVGDGPPAGPERGAPPGEPRKQGSFGLTGLRERAYLLGGDVKLESAPGQGTTVEVRIPVKQEGA